jgi:hypothetical protein
MPEKCPSCGGYMTVKKVLGTVVVSEPTDHKKRTTKYAFTSFEGSEKELCPSCRRALKNGCGQEATGSGEIPVSTPEGSSEVVSEA